MPVAARSVRFSIALLLLSACGGAGSPAAPSADAGSEPVADADAAPSSDAALADADNGPHRCADTFGSALTDGFGRLDGTVWTVVPPSETTCAMPNGDHVVVQVKMGGAVYRMVLNVQSTRAGVDPRVRLAAVEAPPLAPPWAEGWRTGVGLDYPADLGVHTDAFAPLAMDDLSARIVSEVKSGDPISVYATVGSGRSESAHLIHRNGKKNDGAVVLHPGSPKARWLLFHFDGQSF